MRQRWTVLTLWPKAAAITFQPSIRSLWVIDQLGIPKWRGRAIYFIKLRSKRDRKAEVSRERHVAPLATVRLHLLMAAGSLHFWEDGGRMHTGHEWSCTSYGLKLWLGLAWNRTGVFRLTEPRPPTTTRVSLASGGMIVMSPTRPAPDSSSRLSLHVQNTAAIFVPALTSTKRVELSGGEQTSYPDCCQRAANRLDADSQPPKSARASGLPFQPPANFATFSPGQTLSPHRSPALSPHFPLNNRCTPGCNPGPLEASFRPCTLSCTRRRP